jgi:hypothetical protein
MPVHRFRESLTRMARALGLIATVRCERYDATGRGDVLARRTTKGARRSCTLLNASRDQRMRSLKPRTIIPRRASAIESWGFLACAKREEVRCERSILGVHRTTLP